MSRLAIRFLIKTEPDYSVHRLGAPKAGAASGPSAFLPQAGGPPPAAIAAAAPLCTDTTKL